jgi:hypothetical protein
MPLPILDRVPSGRSHDYQFPRIQEVKGITELAFDPAYKNPLVTKKNIAQQDQDLGGTCVGQSSVYTKNILYMGATGDLPTDADRAQYQKDVTDVLGTVHDILYPKSFSAECVYQMSRKIGGITYPSGSEIRFAVRAMKEYGCVLESQWHTDKKRTHVWDVPHETADGGLSAEDAAKFAANHIIDGYAMCGRADGYATWDQIKYAIFTKGVVLGAIPVYDNYTQMQGGDGSFPDPRGEICGYHALCFYGYDEDNLYLIHSWGDFCGMFGSISKKYFDLSIDQSVWMVVLDTKEVEIGKEIHRIVSVTANVPATISVDGVVVGPAPQKLSLDSGKTYQVTASADGYISQVKTVDDGTTEISFVLETVPQPVKSWREILEDFLKFLVALFKR